METGASDVQLDTVICFEVFVTCTHA